MVRVPQYTNKEISSPGPNTRVSTALPEGSFGAGASQVQNANNQLLDTASKIFIEEKQKADKAKVNEAYSQLTSWRNTFTADAKTRVGEGAFTLPDEFQQQYDEQVSIAMENLHNDTQKAAFNNLAMDTYATVDGTVKNKVSQEQFNFRKQKADKSKENDIQFAIQNFDNLEIIADSKSKVAAHVADMDWLQGDISINDETGEVTATGAKQAEYFDSISKMHIGVVQNLITQNTNSAKKYYKDNKDEINQSNMNDYTLDVAIKAFHKSNVESIENYIVAKEMDNELTPQDILKYNMDVEEGGIGSTKVKKHIDRLKKTQENQLNNIIEEYDVKRDTGVKGEDYVNLVRGLTDDTVSRYELYNVVIDAYSDRKINAEEKKEIKSIADIMKHEDFRQTDQKLFSISTWGVKKKINEILSIIDNSKFKDEDIAPVLKSLIKFNEGGEKSQEENEEFAFEAIRQMHIKKNPSLSKYEIDKTYTETDNKGNAVTFSVVGWDPITGPIVEVK